MTRCVMLLGRGLLLAGQLARAVRAATAVHANLSAPVSKGRLAQLSRGICLLKVMPNDRPNDRSACMLGFTCPHACCSDIEPRHCRSHTGQVSGLCLLEVGSGGVLSPLHQANCPLVRQFPVVPARCEPIMTAVYVTLQAKTLRWL